MGHILGLELELLPLLKHMAMQKRTDSQTKQKTEQKAGVLLGREKGT